MTPRERVQASLNFAQPDHTPCDYFATPEIHTTLARHFGLRQPRSVCRFDGRYGIHHCDADPHRFAQSYAKVPNLDFLDAGWGCDVSVLRQHLPRTFLNLRLSPVEMVEQTPDEIRQTVRTLVRQSDNPRLTGVCCINMDQQVRDEQVAAIFEEVQSLRMEYEASEP